MKETRDPDGGAAPVRHDHVCLAFDEPGRAHDEMAAFLERGLQRDEQVWYIAPGPVDELLRRLLPRLRDAEANVATGALRLVSLEDAYAPGVTVDPEAQVDAYAAATTAAEADGFAGLRVAAAVTGLVRTPQQLDSFTRYEHLVDRYMTAHAFSAMCAFDRAELGERRVTALACMHPEATPGTTTFHLCASAHADACLTGELDVFAVADFRAALERADLQPSGDELVIDADGLTFLDHRGVAALDDLARTRGVTVVLRTSSTVPARVVDIVRPAGVRVETRAAPAVCR